MDPTGWGADALDHWTRRYPLGTLNDLTQITYANGHFVAVGHTGTIVTSSDAANWTVQPTPTTDNLLSVCYGGGQFVVTGSGGTILTSADGTAWTTESSSTTNALLGLAYGRGLFVAVSEAGAVLTSTDGKTWTEQTGQSLPAPQALGYGNGRFVCVTGSYSGSGSIFSSEDGITWSQRVAATPKALRAVTYAGGQFVAVGDGAYASLSPPAYLEAGLLTSSDGITWSTRSSGTDADLLSIAYGNNQYVAVGSMHWFPAPAASAAVTSRDGIAWSLLRSFPTTIPASVAYGNDQFVTVGAGGLTYASTNAINWSVRNYLTTNSLHGIASHDLQLVAVGDGGAMVGSDDGGVDWDLRNSGTSNILTAVAYGNGRWVAVGGLETYGAVYGTIVTSSDANTWVPQDVPTLGSLTGVACGNGLFVVVAGGFTWTNLGTILTSPDGKAWTPRNSNLPNVLPEGLRFFDMSGVVYGGGLFATCGTAVALRGQSSVSILSSADGIQWRSVSVALAYGAVLAYGNGQFVAVGSESDSTQALLNSTDGIDWYLHSAPPGISFNGMAYGNGVYVGAGWYSLLTSRNGINWRLRAHDTLSDVSYANRRFVAVGAGGLILVSDVMPLQLEPLARLPDGTIQGMVSGLSATNCLIQSSPDLKRWTVLTNLPATATTARFIDPAATNANPRFYRAVQNP